MYINHDGDVSKMRISNQVSGIEIIELPTDYTVGPVNVFLLYGEKLTLVDCAMKTDKTWDLFNSALKQRGLDIKDIKQIVLTHHHTDHVGLLDLIMSENTVPVYCHENCRPYITQDTDHFDSGQSFFSQFYKEFGVPTDLSNKLANSKDWNHGVESKINIEMALEEGMIIPGLPEWQVIETKGHAQSHISLYRAKDQVLICGDHFIKHSPAGLFLEPPIFPESKRSKPLLQYKNNIEKFRYFPVKLTLSSHGEPIEQLPELINDTLKKIDERALKIKSKLVNTRMSGYELVKELYPTRFEKGFSLFASDTIGFLDLLIERNEISVEEIDGVYYYSS